MADGEGLMAGPSIERRSVAPQATMYVRYTTPMYELSSRITDAIGKAHTAAVTQGLRVTGRPFVRYLAMQAGTTTIEGGLPVASAGTVAGDVEAGELPGGLVAHAVHTGAYDRLGETYRAIEAWAAAQGVHFAGAPWEYYVTDPAANPDQSTWRTEIFWPLQA